MVDVKGREEFRLDDDPILGRGGGVRGGEDGHVRRDDDRSEGIMDQLFVDWQRDRILRSTWDGVRGPRDVTSNSGFT